MLAEQRQAPRKILRVKAMWVMDGAAPVVARTLDIGSTGVSLLLNESVPTGRRGKVTFEMYFDGTSHIVTAQASVIHCIFSSSGFKAGLQFSNLDMSTMTVISRFMR